MSDIKIAFYDTKEYDKNFFEKELRNHKNFKVDFFDHKLLPETVGTSAGYDVVCIFVNDSITASVVEEMSRSGVKLIALRCAGYNNLALKALYGKINAVRVPAYSPYAVAEHAVALMLALNRKVHKAYYRIRDNNFNISGLLGFDMHGKTVGVMGTGKIGRKLARIMRGFGMKVLLSDVSPDTDFSEEINADYVEQEEIFRKSDIISLHLPLTDQTYHLIGEENLDKMKKGVMLINTSRGKLIDAKALIEKLKSGRIGSAGLDVYEEESEYFFEDLSSQMISDDVLARLLTFPNVVVTSHQGFFTKEALCNIARTTLSNIEDFFQGKYLKNEVCYRCDREPCAKKGKKRCF